MADERHEDWADTPADEYSATTCTNPKCEGYCVSVSLRCYRDEHDGGRLVDERDLDCQCGAQRVEVESLGVEQVPPEIIERYREIAA